MSQAAASCPTPGKRSYETAEAAVWFARADGLRAYQCRCGLWHLSSKPKPGGRMGIARRRRVNTNPKGNR